MRPYSMIKNSILGLTFGLSLVGCGKQTFDVLQRQQNADAPGGINVPARVDILMVLDNTGSMSGKEAFVAHQIRQQFLGKLDSQSWDYRLAVIPTSPSGSVPLQQMAVSKYSLGHSNYVQPYMTADESTDSDLRPDWGIARTADQFTMNAISATSSGDEPTLVTIGDVLNNSDWQNRFLRSSAKLVVVVISNGDDTSEPADTSVYPHRTPSTVRADLIARIKSVKPNAKFHSIVNVFASSGTRCLGGTFSPNRYANASAQLGGRTHALCTQSGNFDTAFSTVFGFLAEDLKPIRQEYEQEYLVIDHEPVVSTITLGKRLPNGSLQSISPATSDGLCASNMTGNGWCYEGQGSVFEITTPVFRNFKTGYKIRLIGTARAIGNENLEIHYQEFGTGISH